MSFLTDVLVGPASLTPHDVWLAVIQSPEASKSASVIVWSIRLPTAVMALLVGASLGIAGAGMQTILDNPLSSPYTLGISAGAGFGASLAVVVGLGSLELLGEFMVPFGAFVFACLTSFFIYSINKIKNFSSETMILAGIGMMFLFQALQSLMQYMATPEALQNIVFWTMGSLSKANWVNISIVFIVLLLMLPLMMRESWRLTALKLGMRRRRVWGSNVERLRVKIFFSSQSLRQSPCPLSERSALSASSVRILRGCWSVRISGISCRSPRCAVWRSYRSRPLAARC